MDGKSVDAWMNHEPADEWEIMMKKVAAFHAKHNFAGQNGHDMGYRLALTIEELGELAAAVTQRQTACRLCRGDGGCSHSVDGSQSCHGGGFEGGL